MAKNVHSQLPHTGPQSAAGRNTGRHSPGSTPQGDTARADSIRCCQSHCSSSAPGTPSLSRKSGWWPADACGRCSHNLCAPRTGHPAARSRLRTDTPPDKAGGTALRGRPSWHRSKGRRWCTHQSDCSLDREELTKSEGQGEQDLSQCSVKYLTCVFMLSSVCVVQNTLCITVTIQNHCNWFQFYFPSDKITQQLQTSEMIERI